VRRKLSALADRTRADELFVILPVYDAAQRINTLIEVAELAR
jgi:hypothetical protein